jgi:hypothetical protein
MPNFFPLVVPKRRTSKVGGVRTGKDTFLQEIVTQSIEDVRSLAKNIIEDDTTQQVRLDNQPQRVVIDSDPLTKLEALRFKGEVIFGDTIQSLLLKAVEIELAKAIRTRLGAANSRELANTQANWQWTLVSGGRSTTVSSGSDIGFLGSDDYMVLAAKLNYAGVAAARSAGGSSAAMGYLRLATSKLRRSTLFRNTFAVRGFFATDTSPNRLPDELWNSTFYAGTPCIVVRIKKRKSKPFRRKIK